MSDAVSNRIAARAAAALVATVVLVGCSSATGPDGSSGSSPAAVSDTVTVPDTAAGGTAEWILAVLNDESDTTGDQWSDRLDGSFTAEVSAADLADLVNTQIRPGGPFTVTDYRGGQTDAVVTLSPSVGQPLAMTVTVDAGGRIVGLFFAPAAPDDWTAPADTAELAAALSALPGQMHALIVDDTDVDADTDGAVVAIDPDAPAPIASVFKLYVLLAVADEIAGGDLAWDEELTVTDAVRSLPSGRLQDAPTGTTVTVGEAAVAMIAISDNTATDMLIRRVGRDRVEAAVTASGHNDPDALVPFLTTREMFQIGWSDPDLLERWNAGDQADRRALVAELDGRELTVDVADVAGAPRWRDGADWSASARDVARVLAALDHHPDPRVWQILTDNPGVTVPAGTELGFKGGSSLGVLAGAWIVRGDDRTTYVVVQQATDDPAGIEDEAELFRLAEWAVAEAGRDDEGN